jgi:hypothetical protein
MKALVAITLGHGFDREQIDVAAPKGLAGAYAALKATYLREAP